MSFGNGSTPCLGELRGGSPRGNPRREAPACDFEEARSWAARGCHWQCLHGCFCQFGLSIEWHDFSCDEPEDWARSFHPESVELCLNLSGHGRISAGPNAALFAPMTAGFYRAGHPGIAAWRLAGERHQFLTFEFSRPCLQQFLADTAAELHPVVRAAVENAETGPLVSEIRPLPLVLRKKIESLCQPVLNGAAKSLWYQGQAIEVMAEFFYLNPDASSPTTRQVKVARRRVETTIQLLTQNLAEPPTLEELGRKVGCSPYYLSRTFSKEIGMTIPQYLRQIRMERAADLLKSGRFNVTEAALEVGYSSLSHFSHAFYETIGCCPGLYPLGVAHRPPKLKPGSAGRPG